MKIDNFDVIERKLILGGGTLTHPEDFHVVHVIQRMKDLKKAGRVKDGDSNGDGQRLIKTWYVNSLEYLEKKADIIRETAESNGARAYMLTDVRNRLAVNRDLAKRIIDAIDDTELRYDHLIRSAVCGCHRSRRPYWVIDVDVDMCPVDYAPGLDQGAWLESFVESTRGIISSILHRCNPGRETDLFTVPTPNGIHIVTPPFDRTGVSPELSKRIMKDAMTLLYYNDAQEP